jgi:hypothetical protein
MFRQIYFINLKLDFILINFILFGQSYKIKLYKINYKIKLSIRL